jgi:hypothetical protein
MYAMHNVITLVLHYGQQVDSLLIRIKIVDVGKVALIKHQNTEQLRVQHVIGFNYLKK